MAAELVIDTNVLAHSDNQTENRCKDSINLLRILLEGDHCMIVDAGFDTLESKNRSRIGSEYITHLRYGSPGFSFVLSMALKKRIRQVVCKPSAGTNKLINQLIADRTDRIFIKAALHASDRLLVSHDFEAFPIPKRPTIKTKLDISVLEASDACKKCRC